MKLAAGLICVLVQMATSDLSKMGPPHNDAGTHSRAKRYVLFPHSSYFSIAFCMSFKTLTTDDIFTGGMNLQLSYSLPNETLRDKGEDFLLDPLPVLRRRHRREIYREMELIFNDVGVDGRACMLRALCEAAQRLEPRSHLVAEMLRILLTLPTERVGLHEPPEHHQYHDAQRKGLAEEDCRKMFPKCPLSLLDMALGTV